MLEPSHNNELPPIPAKRYFTIGEVSELCDVKPHVLRYWEQEFPQLSPVKRRGNRRYYQRQDVILVREFKQTTKTTKQQPTKAQNIPRKVQKNTNAQEKKNNYL